MGFEFVEFVFFGICGIWNSINPKPWVWPFLNFWNFLESLEFCKFWNLGNLQFRIAAYGLLSTERLVSQPHIYYASPYPAFLHT